METSMDNKINTIKVYLSSTNFGFFDFRSKNWKTKLMEVFHSNPLIIDNITYRFEFIDPLKYLTDDPAIVDVDTNNIRNSDFNITFLGKKITIGTVMEIMYTSLYNIYSKMYCDDDNHSTRLILIDKWKVHRKHPWIKHYIPKNDIVDNEKQAYQRVKEILER